MTFIVTLATNLRRPCQGRRDQIPGPQPEADNKARTESDRTLAIHTPGEL